MKITDLHPGLLVRDGGRQLKVSTIYATRATFIVEHPLPPRTTVVTLSEAQIANLRPYII